MLILNLSQEIIAFNTKKIKLEVLVSHIQTVIDLCLAINRIPQAEALLADPGLKALIRDGYALANVISVVPHQAEALLADPGLKALIQNGDQLARVIRAAPHQAKALLASPDLKVLIWDECQLAVVLTAAPGCFALFCNDNPEGINPMQIFTSDDLMGAVLLACAKKGQNFLGQFADFRYMFQSSAGRIAYLAVACQFFSAKTQGKRILIESSSDIG